MNRSLEELEIRKKELKEAVDAQRNKLKLIINEYEKISTMIKEMKRSESNQENPLAKLLEKEKISRPRLQMEFKPVVHDTVDFEEEPNTKIRISKVKVSMDTFKARMVGREYIPIEDILSRMIGNDIEGDWVAIAVVYHISKKFENKLGQKIQCFDCTDLRGNCFRLFAVDMVLDQCTKGSVIAVLNCEIIKPSEQNGVLGLLLPSPKLFMKLGESVDCGFCSGFEEKCNQVINKAKVLYCRKHREKLIQSKRNARQEFASGNSSLREGEPIDLNKKKVAVREVSNHATYRIGSETIVAEGFKVKLLSPLKPTVQAANSKEIKSILNSNLPGSKHVRMLFGMEDQEVDPAQLQVFGPSLLKKMGGNPFLREELQLTPTKGSPRKRTVTESPGTPTQTPKKSKNADLSDSDLELEILAPRES